METAFAHHLAYLRTAALVFILLHIPHLPQGEFQDSFEGDLILEPSLEVIILGAKEVMPAENDSKRLWRKVHCQLTCLHGTQCCLLMVGKCSLTVRYLAFGAGSPFRMPTRIAPQLEHRSSIKSQRRRRNAV